MGVVDEDLEILAAAGRLAGKEIQEDAIDTAAAKLCRELPDRQEKTRSLHYIVNGIPRKAAPAGETYIKQKERRFRKGGKTQKTEEVSLREVWQSQLSVLKKTKTSEAANKLTQTALTLVANGEDASQILGLTSLALTEALKATHPATLAIDHELSRHLLKQGQKDEALKLLSRVSAIRVNLLGEQHPLALSTRHELCTYLKESPAVQKNKEQMPQEAVQAETPQIDEDAAAWELARAAILVDKRQRERQEHEPDTNPSPRLAASAEDYFLQTFTINNQFAPYNLHMPKVKRSSHSNKKIDLPLERAERDLLQARYIISQMKLQEEEIQFNNLKSASPQKHEPWHIPRPTIFDPPSKSNRIRHRRHFTSFARR